MQSEQYIEPGTITWKITVEDPDTATGIDIAFIGAVEREVVEQLQQDGYTISPMTEGQKGGEVWLQVASIANEAWQHRQEIEEAIKSLGTLYVLFQGASNIVQRIIQAYKKRTPPQNETVKPCKITIEIDGASMTIEADHFPEDDAALSMAQNFAKLHPVIMQRASAKSQVRVQGKLPNRTSRRRKGRP